MILLAALLSVAPAQAAPADLTADGDVRCFAVMAYATGTMKPEDRAGAVAGTMYFFGRLDGRMPGLDHHAALRRLLTDEEKLKGLQADMARCGAILQKRGADLQLLGRKLKDDAKAQ